MAVESSMKIAVAVSGGMDSLLALALLVEQGFDIFAVYGLFLPQKNTRTIEGLQTCAEALSVPLHCIDLRHEFQNKVIQPFEQAYCKGETPNPCALCNMAIKFGLLFERSQELGATHFATGHYVQVERKNELQQYFLRRGQDARKDQSYFLALVPQYVLSKVFFPLSDKYKADVKQELLLRGLTVPEAKESQEICFVPDDDYTSYLQNCGCRLPKPGPIVLTDGTELGQHHGVWQYTQGQRRKLGIAWSEPLYVLDKDCAQNILIVGPKNEVPIPSFTVRKLNFFCSPKDWPKELYVQVRYRQQAVLADVFVYKEYLHIVLLNSAECPAPGQVAAVYTQDGYLLAGGFIDTIYPKISFYTLTLGCKINQYETQAIAEAWAKLGGKEVNCPEDAQYIVVNSCAVTANAIADLRQAVRKLHKAHPQASIGITGCAVQLYAQGLAPELGDLPGVRWLLAQERKKELCASAPWNNFLHGTKKQVKDFCISQYSRSRAVVMVQDGCSHGCTYCIVPLTRGPSVSRIVRAIENDIAALVNNGFSEIVLSGVNLRSFGRDLPEKINFWNLVESLEQKFSAFAGQLRFRMSSLEPGQLGTQALDTLARSTMLAPHLHISLQSGDETVLKLMGRGHYKPSQLLDFLEELKNIWPIFGLGADILLGFPGETAECFERTLDFLHALPLSYAHVFPYSPRPNTKAVLMPKQVSMEDRKKRAAMVRELVREKKKMFLEKLATTSRVTVALQGNTGYGMSEYYVPCQFVDFVENTKPVQALITAQVVGIENGTVLVQKIV